MELHGLKSWEALKDQEPFFGLDRTREPYRLSPAYKPPRRTLIERIRAAINAWRFG